MIKCPHMPFFFTAIGRRLSSALSFMMMCSNPCIIVAAVIGFIADNWSIRTFCSVTYWPSIPYRTFELSQQVFPPLFCCFHCYFRFEYLFCLPCQFANVIPDNSPRFHRDPWYTFYFVNLLNLRPGMFTDKFAFHANFLCQYLIIITLYYFSFSNYCQFVTFILLSDTSSSRSYSFSQLFTHKLSYPHIQPSYIFSTYLFILFYFLQGFRCPIYSIDLSVCPHQNIC